MPKVMTKRKRAEVRWLIACLSCCIAPVVMAGPLCVDSNPLAGRSAVLPASTSPGDGGIGGTGRAPDGPETGGVGGTGVRGERAVGLPVASVESMGIVGVVTGFASVCVNGLEVHIDDATPVSENGRTAHVGNLAVGQFVSIDARASAGGLRASDIAIVHLNAVQINLRPATPEPTMTLLSSALAPDAVFQAGNALALVGWLADRGGAGPQRRLSRRFAALNKSTTTWGLPSFKAPLPLLPSHGYPPRQRQPR